MENNKNMPDDDDLTIAKLYEKYNSNEPVSGEGEGVMDVTAVLEDGEHLLASEQRYNAGYTPEGSAWYEEENSVLKNPHQMRKKPQPSAQSRNTQRNVKSRQSPKTQAQKKPAAAKPAPQRPKSNRQIKRIKMIKRKQTTRTFAHILGSVMLVVLIVSVSIYLGTVIVRAALDYTGITDNEFQLDIEIPEDCTPEQVADILYTNGIIIYPEFFKTYLENQESTSYNAGIYTFDSSMQYSQMRDLLQNTTIVRELITLRIQEGMTAREIGELLEENSVCYAKDFEEQYLNKLNVYNFEKRVTQSSQKCFQMEGFLYPDTYEFYVCYEMNMTEFANEEAKTKAQKRIKTAAEDAADSMYSNFNQKFTKAMYKTINEMGFTLDEFVTLASMVQKEAGTVEDMQKVASVFLNRLAASETFPLLQSDVTEIYANENIAPYLKENGKERQAVEMVKRYNTYESKGLPPGPVCNPGMGAMEAVINAPKTDYYYFCANEETLETFFAVTLEEHEQNLIKAGLVAG